MHFNTQSTYKPHHINLSIETVCPIKGESWVLEVGLKGRRIRANPSQSSSTTEALFFKDVNLKFPFVTHGDLEFKLSRSGHLAQGVFELQTLANSSSSKVIQRKTQLTWMGGGIGLGPAPVVDFRIALDPPPPASLAESVWQVSTPDNLHSEQPDNLLFVTEEKRRPSKQLNVASIWGGMVDESIVGAPPPMRKRNSTTHAPPTHMAPTHGAPTHTTPGIENVNPRHTRGDDSSSTCNRLKRPSSNGQFNAAGGTNTLSVRVPTLGGGNRRESCSEIEQANPMMAGGYRRQDRHAEDSSVLSGHSPLGDQRQSCHAKTHNHSSANSSSGSSCRHSERKDGCGRHGCCCSGHTTPHCNSSNSLNNESHNDESHNYHQCNDHHSHSRLSKPSPQHSSSSGQKSSAHSYGERESNHHNADSMRHRHGTHSPYCCQHSHCDSHHHHHSNSRGSSSEQHQCDCDQQHYREPSAQPKPLSSGGAARRDSSTVQYRRGVEERRDSSRREGYSNSPQQPKITPPHSPQGGGYYHDRYYRSEENSHGYYERQEEDSAYGGAAEQQRRRHSKQVDLNRNDNQDHSGHTSAGVDPRLPQPLIQAVAARHHYH